jgi:hypothetical protein
VKAIVVHPGPAWSTADVYRGWVRGLVANGVEVQEFNLDDRLAFYDQSGMVAKDDDACPSCGRDETFYKWFHDQADVAKAVGNGLHSACYQAQPDIVLVISAAFVPVWYYDIIRRNGSKVVVVHTESPYEDERQLVVAPHADVNLINDPANIERWRSVAPTWYVPHSYDPAVHHPGPSRFDLDVCWIGTAGHTFPSRMHFMEKVQWPNERVGLGGLWQGLADDSPLQSFLLHDLDECLDNDDTTEVYRGSKMSFNLYRSDGTDDSFAGGWAMGPREVELAATGCFQLRHSPPDHGGEGDEVLPMLPTFTQPGELSELMDYFLRHDDQRRQLADDARAAIADRTFEAQAAKLLRRLNNA